MTTPTNDTFSLKITGPGMAFDREIDPAIIPKLIQLAFGGQSVTSPSPWEAETDPRVDLDDSGDNNGGGAKPQKATKKAPKKGGAKKIKVSATKGINFAPDGQVSWKDFATQKKPTNNWEKALVAVYYMRETLGRKVSTGDVIAAFNLMGWTNPADPANNLQVAAHKMGWLETGDMNDIQTVWAGENHVESTLPKSS